MKIDSYEKEIQQLITDGALFVINHSGGKDSQMMTIELSRIIPKKQLVIVHSHLPEVEWEGVIEHINEYSFGIPVNVVQARKTFFEMVSHRKKFPDAGRRQCTSDLKRGPIQKFINNYAKKNGFAKVVNCTGIRAAESHSRAKRQPFMFRPKQSAKHRQQFEWLPIFDMATKEVFSGIAAAGQKPHWAYSAGMTRLSCVFCILASKADLSTAARLRPDLYKKYCDKEKELNFTLSMSGKSLPEITGIAA